MTAIGDAALGEIVPNGTVLGRHKVLGRVTEGAMAVVYLGRHVETGARVAVKVLRGELAKDEVYAARFAREAEVMGRLAGNEHIVQVHDVGKLDDGRPYLVMELVRGNDLAFAVSQLREPMPVERACRIMRDVAAGLAAAHAKKVVHRDLTPSNIMLSHHFDGSGDTAKIVDFGVSSDLGAKGRAADLTVGGVLGTPEYMAPEQAAGVPADPSFDVFAAGVILYELLAGERPAQALLRMEQLPDIATVREDVPAEVAAIVRECLRVDVAQRLASAELLRRRLDGVLASLGAAAATGSVAPRERDAGRVVEGVVHVSSQPHAIAPRRRGMTAAVALLVALVGAASAWHWLRPGAQETADSRAGVDRVGIPAAEAGTAVDPVAVTSAVDPNATPATSDGVDPKAPADAKAATTSKSQPPAPSASESGTPSESGSPAPKPKPKAKPEPTAPSEPSPPAATPRHETAACREARDRAAEAKRSRKWPEVLTATDDKGCWASAGERLQLRLRALSELGRFDACVREGGSTKDAKAALIVELCRKQLGEP
jgi:serine/threonine-protein kinase